MSAASSSVSPSDRWRGSATASRYYGRVREAVGHAERTAPGAKLTAADSAVERLGVMAREHGRLVRQHIAEQIVGQDHVVAGVILHEVIGRGIGVLISDHNVEQTLDIVVRV